MTIPTLVRGAALAALLLDTSPAQVTPGPSGYSVFMPSSGYEMARFPIPTIGGQAAAVSVQPLANDWFRVACSWNLAAPVAQDEVSVEISFQFEPDHHWMPHLTPILGVVAAQRIFRSPAIISGSGDKFFAAIPDLDLVGQDPDEPWFLDYDSQLGKCWIGMSNHDTPAHVIFTKAPGMILDAGPVELAFFVKTWADASRPANCFREPSRFLWERWGGPNLAAGKPHTNAMHEYVETAYEWAFDRWERQVWLEGGEVGAARLVTDYSESPTAGIPPLTDRPDTIWNQAWYCSLRSASGMFRHAKHTGDAALLERAMQTKRLALAAPNDQGIFPSVLFVDGVPEVDHEFDLAQSRWTNSDRSPLELGITPDWYHVVDASNTALWMLRWYLELEDDKALVEYVRRYLKWVSSQQDGDGFFPAWVHPHTLAPHAVLADSPETVRTASLLLEYAEAFDDASFRATGLRALDAVLDGPASEGRWEDFETYWSDNFFGRATNVGVPFLRNGQYKENTLSIFWTSEACLVAYRATGDPRYLDHGIAILDELSMWQQVWRPPFMHVPTTGGFGVMNADAEWNDARQSLFAELFLQYYEETGEVSYFERGIAALRASFAMMYTPLNPETKVQWELARPTLTSWDYGFTMENYGHDTESSPTGGGIGFFSIFDWGCGSASEAFTRIVDHFGHVYIDATRGNGFGIDSIDVTPLGGGQWQLTDLAGTPRTIQVVFDDGTSCTVSLNGSAVVP